MVVAALTLVSAEVAIEHMQEELVERGLSPMGTWYVRTGESNALVTVTFMNDGRYLLVENGVPEVGETSGGPGVEYGTYEWDSTTGVLTTQVAEGSETLLTDTNGDWGLSDPQGTMTMVIEGDTATFTESDGDPADARNHAPPFDRGCGQADRGYLDGPRRSLWVRRFSWHLYR